MRHLTVLLLLTVGCSLAYSNLSDCKTDQDCQKVRADLVCDTTHDLCVQKACTTDSDCASVGSNIVCDPSSKLCVVGKNPTCKNGCQNTGASECVDNSGTPAVHTCQTQANGCLGWSAPQNCPSGQTCASGQCGCASTCPKGATQCNQDGSGFETCQTQADGCLGWSTAQACPGGQTCSSGRCASTCTDACAANATQCSSDASGVETCAQQSNGCLGWSAAVACDSGKTCSGGQCKTTCTNVCTKDATRCAPDGAEIQTCNLQANGCTDWSAAVACPAGQTCSNGQCATTCTNVCTQNGTRCAPDGSGIQTCSVQANGCTDWSASVACPQGQACSNNQCAPTCTNGCATAGAKQCTTDGTGVEACQTQANGCLGWSAAQACPSGQTCTNNQCACPTVCTSGGKTQCSGTEVETCVTQANGCLGWSAATVCPSGQTCTGSACACQNNCNHNGDAQCTTDGSGYEICMPDSNGCLNWSSAQNCATGKTCQSGQCVCPTVCAANTTQCSGTDIETCETQSTGCLGWSAPAACPSGDTCQTNQCACTNACTTAGASQCSSDSSGIETCATQSNGCLGWNDTACGPQETCLARCPIGSPCPRCICSLGWANCDGIASNGCETNLKTDGANCGSCGHSCGGGACSNGQCQPVTLASSVNQPVSIAVNGSGVFWLGNIIRPIINHPPDYGSALETANGSGNITLLYAWFPTSNSPPIALAVDSAYAYWLVGGGEIGKSPLVTGGSVKSLVASIAGTPSAIAVDSSHVYWTTNVDATAPASGNAVEMSSLDGSSVTTLWGYYPCIGVTASGGDAYVTTVNPDRVVQEASGKNNLVANTVQPRAITSNGTDLFWTSDSGAIYEQPISFSSYTPTKIVSGLTKPVALAADATSVVWVDESAGTVGSYDLASATTTTLATGQVSPDSIALDSKFVYWSNLGSGTGTGSIMKVAR